MIEPGMINELWQAAQQCKPDPIERDGRIVQPSAFAIVETHGHRVVASIEWRYDFCWKENGEPLGTIAANDYWGKGMLKTAENTPLAVR